MIQYPDFIIGRPKSDNCSITTTLRTRNLLSVRMSEVETSSILCIMMNPSIADSRESDRTINKVLNLLENTNTGTVEIVNLYPVYKTESAELFSTLEEVKLAIGEENNFSLLEKNNELIHAKLDSAELSIFAWGDPPEHMPCESYNKHSRTILRYAATLKDKQFCVFDTERWGDCLTNMGHPRHPSRNNLIGLIPGTVDSSGKIRVSE